MFNSCTRCFQILQIAGNRTAPMYLGCSSIPWTLQNSLRRRYTAFKLRPYQEECIEACLTHMKEGKKRLAISLATGSGKTVIFTNLIHRVPSPTYDATRTIILVHRNELAQQAVRHCQSAYPDSKIEIEMGNHHASGFADITVASVQSLISRDRMLKFDPKGVKLILIDEAHHAAATSYLRILDYFGAGTPDTNIYVVGVSATLSRLDGLKLGRAMDHVVYHKDYLDMIYEKWYIILFQNSSSWLADVKFTSVKSGVDLSQVKVAPQGDFVLDELSEAVNTMAANEITVRAWLDRAAHRKSTLVFCVNIQHVRDLTASFRKYGIDARYVTSNTAVAERQNLIRAFKQYEYPVLVNCGIFTEGTDIPNIDCIVLARPTRSRNLLIQMIGRGLRLHDDKGDCHVIDMVDGVTKGLVCVPTLFGLDPSELLEDATIEDLERMKREKPLKEEPTVYAGQSYLEMLQERVLQLQQRSEISYTDWSSLQELLQDSKTLNLREITSFAWVNIDENKYILQIVKKGFIQVELDNDNGTYFGTFTSEIPSPLRMKNYFVKPVIREIFAGLPTLEQAIHAADVYAVQKFPRVLLVRTSRWRSTAPPSPAQVQFLQRLFNVPEFTGTGFTKGQAADLIVKMKHGFRRTMRKAKKDLNREKRELIKQVKYAEKEQLKIEKQQKRLDLQGQKRLNLEVGPLA